MSDRRRLPLEQVALGFLMQQPMHGYDLYWRANDALGHVWTMGVSNVYGALNQIEEAGYVRSVLQPQPSRPARRVYHITDAGRVQFLDWVREPVPSIRAIRVEFITKLFFLQMLGLEGAAQLIAEQEAFCQERIGQLEGRIAGCAPFDFNRLVFDFRLRQVQGMLAWLGARREESSGEGWGLAG